MPASTNRAHSRTFCARRRGHSWSLPLVEAGVSSAPLGGGRGGLMKQEKGHSWPFLREDGSWTKGKLGRAEGGPAPYPEEMPDGDWDSRPPSLKTRGW